MKKNHFKIIFSFFAAFLAFSCASTAKVAQNENQNEQAQNQAAQNEAENEENQPVQDDKSNQISNPLAAIIEQNVPESNLPKSQNQEENSNATAEPEQGNAGPAAEIAEPEPTVKNEEELKSEPAAAGTETVQVQTAPAKQESKNQKNLETAKKTETAQEPETKPENETEDEAEKIDEQDLLSDSRNDGAPTADETAAFSEPDVTDIVEEPEVVPVEEKIDRNQETEPAETNQNSAENPEETAAEITEPKTEEPETEKTEEAPQEDSAEPEPKSDEETEEQNSESETEPETEAENESQETEKAAPVPSRSVTIKLNQYLDVIYPGNGWIYLGENDASLLRYFGRRVGNGNTTFTLRSTKAGTTLLHFYKNDALTGNYIDDYLSVTVENEKLKGAAKATAPSYAEIVPPQFEKRRENRENAAQASKAENESINAGESSSDEKNQEQKQQNLPDTQTKSAETASGSASSKSSSPSSESSSASKISRDSSDVRTVISTPEETSESGQKTQANSEQFYTQQPARETQTQLDSNVETEPEVQVEEEQENAAQVDESLLEKAKQLFEEKKYEESLENAQKYINGADKRLDEAYYLLGQLYESDSSIKNIRNAVDAYDTVTKNYPLSKLWRNANQRSVYLKRFYIDIR